MEVINVGGYPPPYGGVANHIKRLKEFLDTNAIRNTVIDLGPPVPDRAPESGVVRLTWRQARWRLFFHRRALLHMHSFDWSTLPVLALLGLRHVVILSFHNERFLPVLERAPAALKPLVLGSLNRLDLILVDSPACRELALRVVKDPARIRIVPEYIPSARVPDLDDSHPVMRLRREHRFLIASNAFKIIFHQGCDLYGLDLLIELTARLRRDGLDVACCFLLPQIGEEDYFRRLEERIRSHGLAGHFLFVTTPLEDAASLWRVSDVMIRATNTDGNSLSVLESLHLGTPVIASDCAERPGGVVLFKSRDLDDLQEKTQALLADLARHKAEVGRLHVENNAPALLAIYRQAMEE